MRYSLPLNVWQIRRGNKMTDLDRINTQAGELKAETERLAKRKDGVYYTIAIIISLTALALALLSLLGE